MASLLTPEQEATAAQMQASQTPPAAGPPPATAADVQAWMTQPYLPPAPPPAPMPPPGPAPAPAPAPTAADVAIAPQQQGGRGPAGGPAPMERGPQPGIAGPAINVGGGVSPAHEVATIGPTGLEILKGAQERSKQYGEDVQRRGTNEMLAHENAASAHLEGNKGEDLYQERIAAIQAEKKAALDKLHAEIQKDSADLANTQIDPNRYWNNKSTGAKIGLAIGAFMSGALAGYQGRNPENYIGDAIERDVTAQRDAYNARSKGVDAKRSLYGQLVEKYGSQEQAEAVLRDSQFRKAQNMVAAAGASAKGQEAIGRAAALTQDIDQARSNQLLNTVRYVPTTATAGKALVPVRSASGAIVYVSPEKALDYDTKLGELEAKRGEGAGKAQESLRGLAVHMPDGSIRIANNAEEAKQGAQVAVYARNIENGFRDAERLRAEIRAKLARGDLAGANADKVHLERIGLDTAKAIESAGGQGILREGEVPNALKKTTGYTSLEPGSDASLQMGRKWFANAMNTALGVRAPHQGQMQIVNGIPQYSVVEGQSPAAAQQPPSFLVPRK